MADLRLKKRKKQNNKKCQNRLQKTENKLKKKKENIYIRK